MTEDGPKRGPYTLLHKLGEGGMGTVWLARLTRQGASGDFVALKTLSTPDARLLHRFRREIRLLRHLDHPGVVELLDEGLEADGTPWYVMRLLKGQPLLSHLRKIAEEVGEAIPVTSQNQPQSKPSTHILTDHWTSRLAEIDTLAQIPPTQELLSSRAPTPKFEGYTSRVSSSLGFATTLAAILASQDEDTEAEHIIEDELQKRQRIAWGDRPIDEPLRWLRQLCATLAYVHGEGIVHCDLKPENIVITDEGDAILVDFGIAERFGARVSHEVLEAAGVQAGTPHYISPEQIRGEPVDARTDLYALGCILYEILTGTPPFNEGTATSILMRHLARAPRPPSDYIPQLPDGWDLLCERLLGKSPRGRFGHALAVGRALEHLGVPTQHWENAPESRPYLYKPGLAGRESLTLLLHERVLDVKHGAQHAIAIAGESGAGKSRVGAELIARARSQGMLAMTSQSQLLDAGVDEDLVGDPLHAFTPMLRQVADACLQEGAEWTARLFGSRARLLFPYAPFLAHLPGIDLSPTPPARDPERARARLFYALARTLQTSSMGQPALFLFDDLHFADELSLSAISYLIDYAASENLPWLIAIMYRSEELPERLDPLLSDVRWETITLERLGPEALGELTAQMLGLKETPRALLELVTQRTGGNPFFVAEYLRLALEEGLLQQDNQGAWQLVTGEDTSGAIAHLPVPASIQELIRGRLTRLAPDARALVDAVAVLGRARGSRQLAKMLSMERGQVREQLAMLARRELLVQEREDVTFFHEQLRETAYHEIEPERRRDLHGRAAKLLQASSKKRAVSKGQLAHHWERAGELDTARELFIKAAREALENHALGMADELLQRACAICKDRSQLLDLKFERVESVLMHTLAMEQAGEQLEEIITVAREEDRPSIRARALRMLGEVCILGGDTQRAERLLREARARYEQLASSQGQADVWLSLGKIKLSQLELGEAQRATQRALDIYRRIKNQTGLASALVQQGDIAWRRGRIREAESAFSQARSLHQRVGDVRGAATSLVWLGQLSIEQNNPSAALAHASAAREQFEELEDPSGLAQCEIVAARAERALGNDLDALEHAERARALLRRTRDPHHEILAMAEIAAHHIANARVERAREIFKEAESLGPPEVTSRALESFATLFRV